MTMIQNFQFAFTLTATVQVLAWSEDEARRVVDSAVHSQVWTITATADDGTPIRLHASPDAGVLALTSIEEV